MVPRRLPKDGQVLPSTDGGTYLRGKILQAVNGGIPTSETNVDCKYVVRIT